MLCQRIVTAEAKTVALEAALVAATKKANGVALEGALAASTAKVAALEAAASISQRREELRSEEVLALRKKNLELGEAMAKQVFAFKKRIAVFLGDSAVASSHLRQSTDKFHQAAEGVSRNLQAVEEKVECLQSEVLDLRCKNVEMAERCVSYRDLADAAMRQVAGLEAEVVWLRQQVLTAEMAARAQVEEVVHALYTEADNYLEHVEALEVFVDALKDLIAKETGGVWQGPMVFLPRKRPRGGQAVCAAIEPACASSDASGSGTSA